MRSNDPEALEVLRRGLKDERAEFRYYTVGFFTDLGLNAVDAAADLESLLDDTEAIVRTIAAVALVKMDRASKAVIEVLKEGLKSPKSDVREFAAYGLKKLGNPSP